MKKILKNIRILNLLSGIFMQFLTAIFGLIIPNMIIHTYGSVINGLLSTVTQMMSYLSVVEMGIASASLVSLFKPMAEHDYDKANTVFAAVNHFYRKVALAFAIGSLGCGLLATIVIKDDIPAVTIWLVTMALGGSNFVAYWYLNKYKVLLQADDKLYLINFTHSLGVILQFVFSYLFIKQKMDISLTKGIVIATNMIEWFILLIISKHYLPQVNLHSEPDFGAIHQRKNILIHQILYIVLNHTDILLLTLFAPSLTAVSIYAIYNMVSTLIYNATNTIIGMFSSKIGQLISIRRLDDVRKILNKYEVRFGIVLFSFYCCMAILIMPFISVYTKGVVDADYYNPAIGILFSIFGITRMFRLPYSEVVSSAGHFKETQIQAVIEVVVNLALSIILLPSMGIPGVLIGSIAGELYRTVHTYIYCHKKLVSFDYIRSIILGITNSTVFCLLYNFYVNIRNTLPDGYLQFALTSIRVFVPVFAIFSIVNYTVSYIYKKMGRKSNV